MYVSHGHARHKHLLILLFSWHGRVRCLILHVSSARLTMNVSLGWWLDGLEVEVIASSQHHPAVISCRVNYSHRIQAET